ncbi:MAG: glycosyltransferase family 2 protein [Lachnospiraceae bacterium]|nr:glycosyltransferase family 2 protein [Lachnospiraceae bacterium]MCI8813632.1 glycosyltransferase family 2 protein [Lachnospiraceae bacterium]
MKELVSVVIPAYNRENTIIRAINSVLNQTYSDLEVIVVDDCSTDNTKEAVLSICDSRVKYHRLDCNSGACVARNTGVALANGEIIAFQDSDDFWHENKLERQLAYIKKENYDFITCGFYRIIGDERYAIGIKECPEDSVQLWCELLNYNWVSTQTIVCKKACFEKISFDPIIKRFQDWDLALQAANYFKIGCLNECLVDVYLQENSVTKTVKNYEAMLAVIEKHKVDVKVGNNLMQAQYMKSLADVHRGKEGMKAGCEYFRSFVLKPNYKILILSLLSTFGIMRFYTNRHE